MSIDCVAVLGGTGTVGRALASAWAPGRLRILVHRSRPAWLAHYDVEACAVDLASVDALRRALDGATAFIDLLRPAGDGARLATAERVSEALAGSGIRRVVHASSIDVYGTTRAAVVDGDTPPEPVSPYAREHLDAEAVAARRPLSTAIVRLGAVFGPGSGNLVALADEVAVAPAWRLAARRAVNGARRFHLVSVATVAQALAALVAAGDPPARLVITDDAAPENDFAHVQDLLIAALHRPDVSHTPVLPRLVLHAALAWRGHPAALAHRRFAPTGLEALLRAAAAEFPARLRAYVADLTASAGRSAA